MQARAGGAGEGLEAAPFGFLLPFQMRLHIHARLGASENNEIHHRHSMTR